MANDPAATDFDRGRRVGKYEVLTRLSTGGMAELYLAFLPGPGGFKKFVALKQILPEVKADESFVKMFLDEARITAAFSHPNIAQIFDLGEDPASRELYLAMEFIAGQNLAQVLKRAAKRQAPLPIGFACRVIRDVALGLHYAHHFADPASGQHLSVVHRDVSPKNVMITYGGQVKMIDFGIAKAAGRLNRTQVGVVKGTSGYMSPEQVRNEALDGRTDLFSVAVMLHELLSGRRLFSAPSGAAMMLKITQGEVPAPTQHNPYVSPELSQVVMKALARQRDQRFATGKKLARALEKACPDLFDDEEVTAFMNQLFEDKIALTRTLFEMANQERADPAGLTKAVQGLATDEQDSPPAKLPSRSSRPLPKVGGESRRSLPKVAPAEEEDTLPPVSKTAPRPKGGGAGVLSGVAAALLAIAGLGWAVTMGPLSGKARELALEDETPRPPSSDKPAWLVEKEAADAELARERERQQRIEDAANEPKRKKLLEEIEAQLAQLDELEAEQRQLKLDARQGKTATEANSKKLDDLQRQIDDLKKTLEVKQKRAAARPTVNADGVLVVRDAQTARAAGVGYVTLRTVNPSSAAIFDASGSLGSSPLIKLPMEVGVHQLRVIDSDSKARVLSVTVEPGKTNELKAIDVSSLPLMP